MVSFSTCSGLAREIGTTLAGTAPRSRGWLLVAFSGPWPHKPWQNNPIDPAAGESITRRGTVEQIKPLFIRRHGAQYEPDTTVFEWAVVDAVSRKIQWRPAATFDQIASAEWLPDPPTGASSASANSPTAFANPPANTDMCDNSDLLYLVCTHGRRDQCCATLGRPVASEADRMRPYQTWECSHVGGHRLAGNLVVLPYGLYYGFVEPDDVAKIVTATESGLVHVPLLRGAALDSPAVQTAKAAIYRASGDHGIDALRATTVEQRSDNQWIVRIEHAAGGESLVRVDRVTASSAPESCGGDAVLSSSWLAELL